MLTDESRPIHLQGENVVLRRKALADAARDYEWASDIELMRLDASEPFLSDFSVYQMEYPHRLVDQNRIQLAIETLEGEHIGNCTCYNINKRKQEAELGILIGNRECWGKGYGSDAVLTFLRYLFDELGLKRVFLHTLEWNIRAQECFTRCGFACCGHSTKKGLIEMEVFTAP